MILPDVQVLVYAYRREAAEHIACKAWLEGVLSNPEELALPDHCLTGFLRIVSNPKIYEDPSPTPAALEFVDRLRGSANARGVTATNATWALLARWVAVDRGVRANLVPDAYLAALAVTHGARLATLDRGFARFPKLEIIDPLAS